MQVLNDEPKLNETLDKLRQAALRRQTEFGGVGGEGHPCLEIDARTWLSYTPDEDWLIFRARRSAERLRHMPLDFTDGEMIVGMPLLDAQTLEDYPSWVAESHQSMPAYAGGDCGHFHPDYETPFRLGIRGMLDDIRRRQATADSDEKRTFYEACGIAIQGVIDYVGRIESECRSRGWTDLSGVLGRIATEPPATFAEAIQLMWCLIVCLWFGDDHYLTCPGRMDRTLRRFYVADLAAGRITRDHARDLISALYIQCNMILAPGSALAVMVGGRDETGRDVTNDLTYLCLEAKLATKLVYPTVAIAWHEGTPPELTDFACRMLATGIGDPAFFNDDLIAEALLDHGVSPSDCRNYMNSTCVEIKVVGASNIWVTDPYYNCPQAVLDVMDRIADGRESEPTGFEDLNSRVKNHLAEQVREHAARIRGAWQYRSEKGCFPLASCFISDCLDRGQDFDRGGARYNWVENSFVGLANMVDSLVAIRHLVYGSGDLTISEFQAALQSDFKGHEDLRRMITSGIPSYGSDNDEADALAVEWAHFLQDTTASSGVPDLPYVAGFFCWIMHGALGSHTGATPDGRLSGTAFADGAGAAQGRETAGPTASVLSTTKWSHKRALGGLVHNAKFSKSTLTTPSGLGALRAIIETYLLRGGFEIQINVTGADTLRDAQAHPEDYPDLLVRVAGYSDYFTHLSPEVQEEVIARDEHNL